jgi:hypothetical protein
MCRDCELALRVALLAAGVLVVGLLMWGSHL